MLETNKTFMNEVSLTHENIYHQCTKKIEITDDKLYNEEYNILFKNGYCVISDKGVFIDQYNTGIKNLLKKYPNSNIFTNDTNIVKKYKNIFNADSEKNFHIIMNNMRKKPKTHIELKKDDFFKLLEEPEVFEIQDKNHEVIHGKVFTSRKNNSNVGSHKYIVFTDASVENFQDNMSENNISIAFLIFLLNENKLSIYSYGYFSGNKNVRSGYSNSLEKIAYKISHNFFPNGSKHIHYMDSQYTIKKANEKNDLAYHVKAHVAEEDDNHQDMGNFFVDRLCKYCKKEKDHMIIMKKIKSDMKNKTKMETISSLQFPN